MDFVSIKAGKFVQGSPESDKNRFSDEKQHEVTIARDFLMKSTPVTQAEWQSLMGNNPSHFQGTDAARPVECVSWYDAIAYCNALSRAEGLQEYYKLSNEQGTPGTAGYKCAVNIPDPDGLGYRLPTESEWEYAARAGTTDPTYAKDGQSLDDIAWYANNSDNCTHAVGQKAPNPWGLYDMLGNVFEWVQDEYQPY